MPSGVRTAMLMSGAIVATFAGGSLAGIAANAQEVPLGSSVTTVQQVEVVGPDVSSGAVYLEDGLQLSNSNKQAIDLAVRDDHDARFAALSAYAPVEAAEQPRAIELELAAGRERTGMPVDVSIAQRAAFGSTEEGDINRRRTGAEIRVGALGDPSTGMSGSRSRIYMFAASDNEAVTWQPGSVTQGYAYQDDRVEIGDVQAGVTYERGPIQASIAYVEREVNYTSGQQSVSNDENFAGFTLTMRR